MTTSKTPLFNNKYRIPSARLRNWDYASEAMYFVTICTKNRENYFGDIIMEDENTLLDPTEIGKIAHSEWYKTIELRPDMNIELGEFVVMPNHVHGIVIIGRRDALQCVSNNKNADDHLDALKYPIDTNISDDHLDALQCVSTVTTTMDGGMQNKFGPQSKNLASIIRGYKTAVTTFARKNNMPFDWQPRYHDHIIRSMDAYHRISEYILANPSKWANDKFYQ